MYVRVSPVNNLQNMFFPDEIEGLFVGKSIKEEVNGWYLARLHSPQANQINITLIQ